jgi:PAS domain S-box-containing protein
MDKTAPSLQDIQRALEWSRVLTSCIETSETGITIADFSKPDNPIIFANPAFYQMSGYDESETLGRNCRFLQGKDHDQPGVRAIREALKLGTSTRQLLRNYRKDGTLFWNSLQISPVRDEAGKITHYVGIQTDVTREVEREEIRRQAELEVQRQKLELQISEAARMTGLGEMAGFIVHEISSPITVLEGRIKALAQGQQAGSTQDLVTCVDRITEIVKNFKRVAHQGSLDATLSLPLKGVIADVEQLFAAQALRLRVDFKIDMKADGVNFTGNALMISQVILNLLQNALYAAKKWPNPWIRLEVEASQELITIRVKNSGSSIPEDVKKRLFKDFVSTKPKGEGTGLGLMICKKIIENHMGRISLEEQAPDSKPDSRAEPFTCFKILLPRKV